MWGHFLGIVYFQFCLHPKCYQKYTTKRNYPILLLLLSLLKSEAKEKFKYLSRKKTQTPIFIDPSTK